MQKKRKKKKRKDTWYLVCTWCGSREKMLKAKKKKLVPGTGLRQNSYHRYSSSSIAPAPAAAAAAVLVVCAHADIGTATAGVLVHQ